MSLLKVFVYGTLKPGQCNYQRYCAGKVVAAQPATVFGRLFALPVGYPAMTAGDALISGVLLSFSDPTVLHDLDRLEDYDPHRLPVQNEYNRVQIEVFDLSGQKLDLAWVYLMTPEQVERRAGVPVASGCWVAGEFPENKCENTDF
ncbi:gamma-glutamylcyclotransferase family protein [Microcoleus sp. FACHB-672]|uniref:gamma-glutamylcyclotransferase family protein n=1 Tax=Microcoleus sp. FACHB-672 TaxID=2692825 RepID=UPI001687E49C|nr:gamma-glutamylcyclotransferase [Microcoleus sp. FACHB-672]MBD2043746.1 gamma-glutamylcyclotransferase [Microcoleus sp. FACHB-672]